MSLRKSPTTTADWSQAPCCDAPEIHRPAHEMGQGPVTDQPIGRRESWPTDRPESEGLVVSPRFLYTL